MSTVWGLIPFPETEGRLLVALDDYINPKIGKNIFGCETIFDHAAKANQSQYPWAQNFVAVGLLKQVKGRWACLFLSISGSTADLSVTDGEASLVIIESTLKGAL